MFSTVVLICDCLVSVGGEIEGSGPVSDVSFSDEKQGVDAYPNQQFHLSEPIL